MSRKRNFHHFMSTGATEKSLYSHYLKLSGGEPPPFQTHKHMHTRKLASSPGSPPPLCFISMIIPIYVKCTFKRWRGESLGGFDHVRTLMTPSVSTVCITHATLNALSVSARDQSRPGSPPLRRLNIHFT